jgi:hypothetical protein
MADVIGVLHLISSSCAGEKIVSGSKGGVEIDRHLSDA